ncbi:MAG: metallophosphoesterase family protein [Candidatus Geothermincolia bacterium]
MDKLRILHTGDVHLGAKLAFLGTRGREQRRRLADTFAGIVELAITSGVQLFIVAGDLFDSNNPSRETLQQAAHSLARLRERGIQVCLLPGTHDRYDARCILRDASLEGPNVHLFTEAAYQAIELPELDVTLYGRAVPPAAGEDILAGLTRAGSSRWHVALAHGAMRLAGLTDRTEAVITPESLKSCGMDYVALGHWHSLRDCSAVTPAWYCGAPEPLSLADREAGFVIMIELGATAQVKPARVSRRRVESFNVDLGEVPDELALARRIEELADSDLMAQVVLQGMGPDGLVVDVAALQEELAPYFLHLSLRDESMLALSALESSSFPASTLVGRFLAVADEMLEQAGEDDRKLIEDATRLGLAHLRKGAGRC